MAAYLEQSLALLKQFEGSVPWMYRDTAGNVTFGVGRMLPYSAAACALPFQIAGRAATQAEISADYARVDALPAGHAAVFYRQSGGLELLPAEIDSLLLSVLTTFESGLRGRLTGYDALPDAVKLVLLDMAYNLGLGGLFEDYPRMLQAIERGAWEQAGAECLRHGIGEARNAWAKAQFLSVTVLGRVQAAADTPAWRRLLYGILGWLASLFKR